MDEKNPAAGLPLLERDDGAIPVLGLGTWLLTGREGRKTVETALRLGYRHVDTARMYENEKEIGAGIRDAGIDRGEMFITTKLQLGELDPQGVKNSCERSLKLLGMDYVDLLLIHWPEQSVPLEDTLGAMAKLKREGKTRHIGVSNFTEEWMQRALAATDEPIFCNEIEYHPYIDQSPPLLFCRERKIPVVAYSPLARGQVARDVQLVKIGRKHGKTAAQVALRWLVRQPGVAAIPKGATEKHLRENIEVFDFELDEEDLAEIEGFQRNQRLVDPDWAPNWDT